MALIAFFGFFVMALAVSLASGNSILVYSSVSRDTQPVSYWMAIGILALCALATGGLAAWELLTHSLP